MENEEDEPDGATSAAAGGDSGAAGEGEGGVVQAQAEEAAAGEHEGGAGHAQAKPADREGEGSNSIVTVDTERIV